MSEVEGPMSRLGEALAGRYRLERELGQGGMATVYLASDLKHDRKVAIKVLRPELAAVIGAERFLREIKTIATLQHSHILGLIDSGETQGTAYYVMPFVEGESLRDRLSREKQLPIADAVRIASEVAAALDYAHRRGVIHRDIKPENILLHEGQALVADFGIALAASKAGGTRMTETGMSLGTPHYMSPEQAMGEREITARSDVYALGCVTYEMLSGEPPFTGPTAQAIVARVMTEEPRSLTQQRKSVPPEVDAAVQMALEKLPADRFASAMDFAQALVEPARTAARSATRGRRGDARGAPPRLAWLLGAAGLGLGALVGWLARRPPVAEAPLVRVLLTPDSAAPPAAHECCAPAIAISPDGRRFAYTARRAGMSTVYLRDRDGFAPQLLYGEGGRHPFFSPDGERVGMVTGVGASVSTRATVVTGTVGGSSWSTVTAVSSANLTGATWASDGTIVLGTLESRGLMRVPVEGGTLEVLTTPDTAAGESIHATPHAVPEANGILFTIWMRSNNAADARIGFVSLSDRRVRVLGRGLSPQYTRSGYLVSATPDGAVIAQRMDLPSGKSPGAPIRVADGISVRGQWTADFAVSREGTLVFDQGHTEATVELLGRDGAARQVPIELSEIRHWDNPRFSPDGRFVAAAGSYQGLHQAYVLDLAGGTGLRLTFEGNTEFMDWGPDGRTIVSVRADTKLVEQAADRSGDERILWEGDGGALRRVSVEGRWIALARLTAGGSTSDILAFHRDSAAPRPYLATRFEELAPTIAPGGRWLAYVSNETGRSEVYVGAFPDASAGRRVVSTEGAAEPQWSRDGRTLYYRTRAGMLVAHEVQTAPALSIGPPRRLFSGHYDQSDDGADFDVHPAGDRFLMVWPRPVGSRLVWMLNAVPGR